MPPSSSPTPVKKSHIGKLYSEKAKKGVGGDAGIKTRFFEQIETSPQNTNFISERKIIYV